jgi:hypothetical protein
MPVFSEFVNALEEFFSVNDKLSTNSIQNDIEIGKYFFLTLPNKCTTKVFKNEKQLKTVIDILNKHSTLAKECKILQTRYNELNENITVAAPVIKTSTKSVIAKKAPSKRKSSENGKNKRKIEEVTVDAKQKIPSKNVGEKVTKETVSEEKKDDEDKNVVVNPDKKKTKKNDEDVETTVKKKTKETYASLNPNLTLLAMIRHTVMTNC